MSKRPIKSIACIGEVMIELIAGQDGNARVGVAGDTYNTAVYLARALRGTDIGISYVTALGTDPYSDRIMGAIAEHDLATAHIERRDGAMPGLYAIDTDDAGERSFSYWRSASAARSLFSDPSIVKMSDLNSFDLVYLSGISLAILPNDIRKQLFSWAESYTAQGGTLAYDSNYRPRLWEDVVTAREVNAAMWARADLCLPSVDDEMDLFGDPNEAQVRERLARMGALRGALKRGAEGPVNLTDQTSLQNLPQVEKVVDSTAAGDSFNAGFLAAHAKGQTDNDAMRQGHLLAAEVIQHPGAIIPDTAQ